MNKILLIENEMELTNQLQKKLELSGYQVITANEGMSGLRKAYNENPDLITKLDKASVDMIKTSNVQTYLAINRLRRIAKQIYPILMVVGSILTIILGALRIVQTAKLEWWVLPAAFGALLIFILLYFLIRGKKGESMDD